ncbi:MAG: hypothetical protein DMG22_11685 [Acidobacteria bacterium]|nr:MAG: hypothetical protein DMG22_11685 [Acidobacteriota bacterium]
MSESAEQAHQEASRKLFMVVWVSLLVLTGVEVFLAYENLEVKLMLIILMTLSIVKASLIISYFMHLRFERTSLVLTLMPALVFVIVMMFMAFPDSVRLYEMKPK